MKYMEIANELDKFVEWADDNDRSIIGTETAISFAEHIAKTVAEKEMKKWDWYMNNIRRVEREACAQIADEWANREQKQYGNGGLGAAIRARGQK